MNKQTSLINKCRRLTGPAMIGLVVLIVYLVSQYFVADQARLNAEKESLIKDTNAFLQSLPDSKSHSALKNTAQDRDEARRYLEFYKTADRKDQLANIYVQMSTILRETGKNYLRDDGVDLSRRFLEQRIEQAKSEGQELDRIGVISDVIYNTTLFDLTGRLDVYQNILNLGDKFQNFAEIRVSETISEIEIIELSMWVFITQFRYQLSGDIPDYSMIVQQLETANNKTHNNNPDSEYLLLATLENLWFGEFNRTKNRQHAINAFNARNRLLEVESKLSPEKEKSSGTETGKTMAIFAEATRDRSMAHRAIEACQSDFDFSKIKGLMDWISGKYCLAQANRILAELSTQHTYWDEADEALKSVLSVLDPVKNRYLWAEAQLEIGKSLVSRAVANSNSGDINQAKNACTASLNTFKQLKLPWLVKEATECLADLTTN